MIELTWTIAIPLSVAFISFSMAFWYGVNRVAKLQHDGWTWYKRYEMAASALQEIADSRYKLQHTEQMYQSEESEKAQRAIEELRKL